jgi:class 3 adenylate cyclase
VRFRRTPSPEGRGISLLRCSTELWEKSHESMQIALTRHDAIVREAIAGHGGFVFKTVGDSSPIRPSLRKVVRGPYST